MLRLLLDAEGLQVTDERKNAFIPWDAVTEIRGHPTVYPDGRTGCAISVKAGVWYYEIRDNLPEWEQQMRQLPRFLPGTWSIRYWRRKVLPPSWQLDVVVYERKS